MLPIQEIIHKFEEGAGKKVFLAVFGFIVALALFLVYDFREFKNLASAEAMDTAQLARNISEGKGYVTDYIRPFSMWLMKEKRTEGGTKSPPPDVYRLREPHPDISNAPLYPLVLAGWMKVVPFKFPIAEGQQFWAYQPDLMIAFLNQLFFLGGAVLVFLLGRKVFDTSVGWVAAILFFGTELFWRFTVSGLSTLMLIDIFLGLVLVLVRLEEGVRTQQKGAGWVLGMSALAGLLLGLGALTRYSFGWLAIPVAAYLLLFLGPQRLLASLVTVVVSLALLAPWAVRNYQISGAFFGTAGYAVESEAGVSGRKLEGSLNPSEDLKKFSWVMGPRNKLVINLTQLVQNELPKLAGSWASALFLACLLIPFRSLTLSRLRILLLLLLATLTVSQALGRTHLSAETADLTSENLIILAAPVVFIFGTGMFYILLGQLRFDFPQARTLVIAAFIVVISAPLLLTLMPPRTYPFAYPPYYPPIIQRTAGWLEEKELMMSDVPAAVAWYGRRRSVGLTLDLEHFYEINDFQRPISGLYMTTVTLDGRLLTQTLGAETRAWGLLLLDSLIRREVPARFPLRVSAPGYFPDRLADQLFLSDRVRWPIK